MKKKRIRYDGADSETQDLARENVEAVAATDVDYTTKPEEWLGTTAVPEIRVKSFRSMSETLTYRRPGMLYNLENQGMVC